MTPKNLVTVATSLCLLTVLGCGHDEPAPRPAPPAPPVAKAQPAPAEQDGSHPVEERVIARLKKEFDQRGWTVEKTRTKYDDASGTWYYYLHATNTKFPGDQFRFECAQGRRRRESSVGISINDEGHFFTKANSKLLQPVYDPNLAKGMFEKRIEWRRALEPVVRVTLETLEDITQ